VPSLPIGLDAVPPLGEESELSVTSYPQRFGHQWFVTALPDRPGPAAALVEVVKETMSSAQPQGWQVLSPHGHRWKLPTPWETAVHPTLSPHGRIVGYLADQAGPYVLHNLLTGQRTEFNQFSAPVMSADDTPIDDTEYAILSQSPSFWSPDGERVSVPGFDLGDSAAYISTVLDADGSVIEIVHPASPGMAAGWASDDELVFVDWHKSVPNSEPSLIDEITVRTVSLDGDVLDQVMLEPATPWQATWGNQWASHVSRDGTEIVVLDQHAALVHRFSLTDGRPTAEPSSLPNDLDNVCGVAWAGRQPTVPVRDIESDNTVTSVIDGGDVHPLVAVEPELGARCIIWAADAVSGEPNGGVFGLSTAWWTWWWRELSAALITLGVLWWLIRRRRARRAMTTTSGS